MTADSKRPAGTTLGPALAGLTVAAVLWFALFAPFTALTRRVHSEYFWVGMSLATALLAVLALTAQRGAIDRLFRFESRMLWIGAAHAVGLYALSRFGVWLLATFFAWVMPQVEAIYATRVQLDEVVIALLLAAVIAPCEEIFWRGFVMDRLLAAWSPQRAYTAAVMMYGFVHVWAMNPMLVIAALVLGAHWSYLYLRYRSLIPGIVSHVLWDVAIFVVLPIPF